jgi:outer membrane protein assembly factor BamB
MKRITLSLAAACLVLTGALIWGLFRTSADESAARWPSFRGEAAAGVADGSDLPLRWDAASSRNVRWKTPIPGIATSSPVVWGDRVFVTTAVSRAGDDTFRTGLYGDVSSVDDLSEHSFEVYALDRETGRILWRAEARKAVPQVKRHLKASQANSTPATDGRRLVALFGGTGSLHCFDMDGNQIWERDLGILDSGFFHDPTYQWGHASSPVIYRDSVIVQVDIQQDSFIAAYRLEDGREVWRTPREEIPTWGTPTIVRGPQGDELVTNGTTIRGYDPRNGELLWRLAPNSLITVATPVAGAGLVFVTAGYRPVQPVYAIRPGGRGDISLKEGETSSQWIAWSHDRYGTYIPTPVYYRGILYTLANNGVLNAYDAETGEMIYRERVGTGGSFSASPVAADGRLYVTSETGTIFVVRVEPRFEILAQNEMDEVSMATPAIAGGMLIVRTMGHVYGIGS